MQFIKADTDRTCMKLGGIEAFTVAGDTIWGALVSCNALVRISTDTWKVQYMAQFPEEAVDGIRLFGGAVHYQGKLIFCPMSARKIAVYDIEKNSFNSISLDMNLVKNSKIYKEDYKTEDIVLYNDFAYIIGCTYPAIIRISLRDLSLKYITRPFEEMNQRIEDYSSGYFGCVTRRDNYLYAGCGLSGDILKFSLEDETYEIIQTDFKGINGVAEKRNVSLLVSMTDQKGYGKVKGDGCYKSIKGLEGVQIVKMICNADDAYLFSFCCNAKNEAVFRYNFTMDALEAMTGIEEGFYNAVESGNRIFAVLRASGKMIEIDMEKQTVKEHILTYSGTILRWMGKGKKAVMVENEENRLKDYLEWVVCMDEI